MPELFDYKNGDIIANKYVVDSSIGVSPAAQSYLCTQNYSSSKICVKSYLPDICNTQFNYPDFYLRASKCLSLDHPNLCKVFEINQDLGRVYSTREYCEGLNFEEWMAENADKPHYLTRGMESIWQAVQGLSALHLSGCHLQVHPNNLIVSPYGTKLLDWDPRLPCQRDSFFPLPLMQKFSCYRAPETTASNTAIQPASDLYALGILIYRLIFNTIPDKSQISSGSLAQHPQEAVNKFLSRALAPDPSFRFTDTAAFADEIWALTGYLKQAPESALNSAAFAPDGGVPSLPTSLIAEQVDHTSLKKNVPPPIPTALNHGTLFENIADSSHSHIEAPAYKPNISVTVNPRPFSLEQKQNPALQNHTTLNDSYTQFGFKGLGSEGSGGHSQSVLNQRAPRNKLLMISSLIAFCLIFLISVLAWQILRAVPKVMPPILSKSQIIEQPAQTNPDQVPAQEHIQQQSELPLSQPEPQEANTQSTRQELAEDQYTGNEKVSALRETQIMNLIKSGEWPSSPDECLQMADDLNDLGRVSESNLTYVKVVTLEGATKKQKILALGGLAVTYHNLNQVPKALEALDALLELDPENRFAKSYRQNIK